MTPLLLSTAYFAPVHFYSRYIYHTDVYIECFENFIKQTYRNRCLISAGNGIIALVVPVVKGRGTKTLIKDVQISYDTEWQRTHWQSIVSAYNSSPYFEYYCDELFPFFQNKTKYLLDYNIKIHETICDFLEIENKIKLTSDFEKIPELTLNLREIISPKNKGVADNAFLPQSYTQVFNEKFDFIPNLSVLDLIFNEGPNSYTVLHKSILAR